MNVSSKLTLVAILAIIALVVGEWFVAGNYWRNKFIQAPADTTHHTGPPTVIPTAPETTSTPAVHSPAPPPKPKPSPVNEQPMYTQSYVDSLLASYMRESRATLRDTSGDSVQVRYVPAADRFFGTFFPRRLLQTDTLFITKYLPEVKNPISNFFVELYPGYEHHIAGGLAIGYDRFGIGRFWMPGADPLTFVSIRFTL